MHSVFNESKCDVVGCFIRCIRDHHERCDGFYPHLNLYSAITQHPENHSVNYLNPVRGSRVTVRPRNLPKHFSQLSQSCVVLKGNRLLTLFCRLTWPPLHFADCASHNLNLDGLESEWRCRREVGEAFRSQLTFVYSAFQNSRRDLSVGTNRHHLYRPALRSWEGQWQRGECSLQ